MDERRAKVHSMTPEEALDGYKQGVLNDDDLFDRRVFNKVQDNDWLYMEPEETVHAAKSGYISQPQLEQFVDHYKNPAWFTIKHIVGDTALTPIQGVADAGRNIINFGADLANTAAKHFGYGMPEAPNPDYEPPEGRIVPHLPAAKLFNYHTTTRVGQFIEGGAEFGATFAVAATKIAEAPALMNLAKTFPRMTKFLVEGLAGGVTGGVGMDPYEKRLSNLAADWWDGFDNVIGFLKADDKDPAWEARIKSGLENALVAVGTMGVVKLSKSVLQHLGWIKQDLTKLHAGNKAEIEAAVNEAAEQIAIDNDIVTSQYHPAHQGTDYVSITKREVPVAPTFDSPAYIEALNQGATEAEARAVATIGPVHKGVSIPLTIEPVEIPAEAGRVTPRVGAEPESQLPPGSKVPPFVETPDKAPALPGTKEPPVVHLSENPDYNLIMDIITDPALVKRTDLTSELIAEEIGGGITKKEVQAAFKFAQDHGVDIKPTSDLRKILPSDVEATIKERYAKKNPQEVPELPRPEVPPVPVHPKKTHGSKWESLSNAAELKAEYNQKVGQRLLAMKKLKAFEAEVKAREAQLKNEVPVEAPPPEPVPEPTPVEPKAPYQPLKIEDLYPVGSEIEHDLPGSITGQRRLTGEVVAHQTNPVTGEMALVVKDKNGKVDYVTFNESPKKAPSSRSTEPVVSAGEPIPGEPETTLEWVGHLVDDNGFEHEVISASSREALERKMASISQDAEALGLYLERIKRNEPNAAFNDLKATLAKGEAPNVEIQAVPEAPKAAPAAEAGSPEQQGKPKTKAKEKREEGKPKEKVAFADKSKIPVPRDPVISNPEDFTEAAVACVKMSKGEIPKPDLDTKILGFNIEKLTDPNGSMPIIQELMKYVKLNRESLGTVTANATKWMQDALGKKGMEYMDRMIFQTAARAGEEVKIAMEAARLYMQSLDDAFMRACMTCDLEDPRQVFQIKQLAMRIQASMANMKSGQANVARTMRGMQQLKANDFLNVRFSELPDQIINDAWAHDGTKTVDFIKRFREIKDTKARIRYLRQVDGNWWANLYLELKQCSVLWGWGTSARNAIGTSSQWAKTYGIDELATVGAQKLADPEFPAMEYLKGSYWAFKNGLNETFRGSMKEAYIRASEKVRAGQAESITAALRDDQDLGNFFKSLMTGEGVVDASKTLEMGDRGIIGDWGKVPIGSLLKADFRALTATDEIFQTTGFHIARYQAAFEEGYFKMTSPLTGKVGLRGQELLDHIQWRHEEMPPEFLKKVLERSREPIFKETLDGWQKQTADWIDGTAAKGVGKFFSTMVKAFVMPFNRITFALNNVALRNTPLGIISRKVRADLAEGGLAAKRRVMQMATGTMILAWAGSMAERKIFQGGIPTQEQGTADAAGILPYSFWDGKQWNSINGLDPIAMPFVMAADLQHFGTHLAKEMGKENPMDRQYKELFGAAVYALGEAVTRQSFMEGMHQVQEMIFNPESGGFGKWAAREAGSIFPFGGAVKDVNRFRTDELHEIGDLFKDWKAIYNGAVGQYIDPNSLPLKRHILYGTPEPREDRTWWGGQTKTMHTDDPALMYFAKNGIKIQKMDDKMGASPGQEITMTPEQHQKAQAMVEEVSSGNLKGMKQIVNALVANPLFLAADPTIQNTKAHGVIDEVRKAAKILTLGGDESLKAEIDRNIQKRLAFYEGTSKEPVDNTTLLRKDVDYTQ